MRTDIETADLDPTIDTEAGSQAGDEPDHHRGQDGRNCTIPIHYDPAANPYVLAENRSRPPLVCRVTTPGLTELTFSRSSYLAGDADVIGRMSLVDRKLQFLATKCVSVAGEFYVKDKLIGAWRKRTKAEAKSALRSDWITASGRFNVTRNTIEKFFADNAFEALDLLVYVPGGSDFLLFRSAKCLNTWFEPPASYDRQNVGSAGFHLLLRVINENLLAEPQRAPEDLLDEVTGEKPTVARWVFHWLASVYQRPGKHIGSTLWFVGSQQGVGKGLLTTAMRYLVGRGNAIQVNQEELKGGWSDFIVGNRLIIGDEVDLDSKKAFYSMLKRWTSNDDIAVRKRHLGQITVPNVVNWIFTTNSTKPISIDPDDRRNTFVATTEMIEARKLAAQFYSLRSEEKIAAYEGLAALLDRIEIDDELINHAIWTPAKEDLIGFSETPVMRWLRTERLRARWPLGQFMSSDTAFGGFSEWAMDQRVYDGQLSRSSFDVQMVEVVKKGYVSKDRKIIAGEKRRGFIRKVDLPERQESESGDEVLVCAADQAKPDMATRLLAKHPGMHRKTARS